MARNIHEMINNGNLVDNKFYAEDQFVWFKSGVDGYIYAANAVTRRYTRYNGEGQNGKRISATEFENAKELVATRNRINEKKAEREAETQVELPEGYHIDSVWDGDSCTYILYRGDQRLETSYGQDRLVQSAREDAEHQEAEAAQVEEVVAEVEGQENTEEIKEIVKEMLQEPREEKKAKKPAKKRVRKVQAGGMEFDEDGIHVVLTPKQVDFMKHLPDTCFWENGLDSCIWVDVLCDEIGGQFEGKPMTVGAMISTICEKGLGCRGTDRREKRKVTCFELSDLGKKVAAKLGLQ